MSSEKRKVEETEVEKPVKRKPNDFAGHLIDDLNELINKYDCASDFEGDILYDLREKIQKLTPEQVKKLKGDAETLESSIEDLFSPAEELQEAIANANSMLQEFRDYIEALLK